MKPWGMLLEGYRKPTNSNQILKSFFMSSHITFEKIPNIYYQIIIYYPFEEEIR